MMPGGWRGDFKLIVWRKTMEILSRKINFMNIVMQMNWYYSIYLTVLAVKVMVHQI